MEKGTCGFGPKPLPVNELQYIPAYTQSSELSFTAHGNFPNGLPALFLVGLQEFLQHAT